MTKSIHKIKYRVFSKKIEFLIRARLYKISNKLKYCSKGSKFTLNGLGPFFFSIEFKKYDKDFI